MNRRSLYSGMKVAYLPSKYSTPRRAIVRRVDRSDGYGATHTLVLCDEDWNPKTLDDGTEWTKTVTSRQIKDWDDLEPGIEEARFAAVQQKIVAQLAEEKKAKAREPWVTLDNLLLLNGIEANSSELYNGAWRINISNAEASAKFVELLTPILTERLFEKSFGRPTVDDDD